MIRQVTVLKRIVVCRESGKIRHPRSEEKDNMKTKKTKIAGFPKEWSDYLNSTEYLVHKKSGMEVCLAGEDLVHNVIWIAFADFPRWLEAETRPEILMPGEDLKRMVKYFRSVDLRKYRSKRAHLGKYTKFEPVGNKKV